VGGVYQVVAAIATRHRSWGWTFLSGIVGMLLAFIILVQWPASAIWVLGLFVGVDLIFRGWSAVMVALEARSGHLAEPEILRADAEERRTGLPDRRVAA
ncbi:MAG TPA: hypothetical protein VMU17_04635, partial [Elusimicrobiota bacterium]|nr:hypothetical protein [Elusimicrobiota bacterium]